jgi:hypothetical protein
MDRKPLFSCMAPYACMILCLSQRDGATLLWHACTNGMEEVAAALVTSGANVNTDAPLHVAVTKGSEGLVLQLLDAGANVNASVVGAELAARGCALTPSVLGRLFRDFPCLLAGREWDTFGCRLQVWTRRDGSLTGKHHDISHHRALKCTILVVDACVLSAGLGLRSLKVPCVRRGPCRCRVVLMRTPPLDSTRVAR